MEDKSYQGQVSNSTHQRGLCMKTCTFVLVIGLARTVFDAEQKLEMKKMLPRNEIVTLDEVKCEWSSSAEPWVGPCVHVHTAVRCPPSSAYSPPKLHSLSLGFSRLQNHLGMRFKTAIKINQRGGVGGGRGGGGGGGGGVNRGDYNLLLLAVAPNPN